MMEALGYTLDVENTKEKVKVYVHSARNHMVEVHYSLWEDYEGSQVAILDSLQLTEVSDLQSYMLEDTIAYTLSPTNHFIFQLFHIIKHFVVKGIGIKQLIDVFYFLNEYGTEIDYARFWSAMDLLGYAEFCRNYFYIAIDYLGMDNSVVAYRKYICDEEKRDTLLEELMTYGREKGGAYDIIAIMSPYLEGRVGTKKSNRFIRILKLLFPMPDVLQDDFSYAKKYHTLLPIAWVHKWCRFLWNRLNQRSISATQKMQMADKRLKLMQEFDLMKK